MPRPQSEAPDLHLERARDRVGSSRTAWCADYWRGECPVQGQWWRGSHGQLSLQSCPKYVDENGKKRAYKSPKTLFFAQKYFTRYTHETFFEEYMNLEAHYFSHCRVISLQSFGSHIRPQPHGLELKTIDRKSLETIPLSRNISFFQSHFIS